MLFGASRAILQRVFPMQYCPRNIKTTLQRIFSFIILSVVSRTTLYRDLTYVMLPQEYQDNICYIERETLFIRKTFYQKPPVLRLLFLPAGDIIPQRYYTEYAYCEFINVIIRVIISH